MTMNTFAQNLNAVMIERGITQTQLAGLTGMAKSSISQYLSGKVDPPDKAKKKLADALNVTIDYFGVAFAEPPKLPAVQTTTMTAVKKITPEQAAKILGQSKEAVRYALQQGVSPFGYACKGKGEKWVYHISPKKFSEYTGVTV